MSLLSSVLSIVGHYKYAITVVVCVAVVVFADENSVMRYVQLSNQISSLKEEIASYRKVHDDALRQLRELQDNPDAYIRIAREKYFMKAADEDVFVFDDDGQ